jgi:hypothetical protein
MRGKNMKGCDHAWLIYRTVRRPAWTVRYRRGFEDARTWWDRKQPLPDATTNFSEDEILSAEDSITEQEAFDDERYRWFT